MPKVALNSILSKFIKLFHKLLKNRMKTNCSVLSFLTNERAKYTNSQRNNYLLKKADMVLLYCGVLVFEREK